MKYEAIPQQDEEIAKAIIGAAIEVHRELGPGWVERGGMNSDWRIARRFVTMRELSLFVHIQATLV